MCSALLLLTSCWQDVKGWFSSTADTVSTTGTADSATPGTSAAAPITLPFGVTIGGNAATVKPPLDQFGTLPGPVPADAPFSVDATADSIIINAFPCDANGNVASDVQPVVILLQNATSGRLNNTIDGKPMTPGRYMMNVTAGQQGTARLVIEIQ
jgi:hypothetical protein